MSLQANSIVESVFTWVDAREVAECVVHHFIDTPGSAENEAAFSDLNSKLKDLGEDVTKYGMCASTQFVGVSSRILPGFTHSGRIITAFGEQAGTVGGENVGAQECVVMTKYSATSSRSGRGRIYIPFVPESFINSGILTTEARDTLNTYWDKILLDAMTFTGGGELDPCIYSRKLNLKYETTSVVTRAVTCTQRRRVVRKQAFAPPA